MIESKAKFFENSAPPAWLERGQTQKTSKKAFLELLDVTKLMQGFGQIGPPGLKKSKNSSLLGRYCVPKESLFSYLGFHFVKLEI